MNVTGLDVSTSIVEVITEDNENTTKLTYEEIFVTIARNISSENTTDYGGEIGGYCSDWVDAQHAVFQLANLCMLISFLTPSNFKHHCFFLRIMLNFCFMLMVVWSSLFVCMPDILTLNAVFIFVNATHLLYLGYKILPDRFSKTLEEVYIHKFKPLRVTRKQFKEMTEFGTMLLLAKGGLYAKQGLSKTGQKLSILLKGRLKVTFDENYLHSIDMNEFVSSPEYDCYTDTGTEDTYQVTISAVEDSLLFSWPQKSLKEHLAKDAFLKHIFDQVIGKDICQKLYEIQERQLCNAHTIADNLPERRSSMVNVRHSIVSNSTSNLSKLNCLQDCLINTEQPSLQSSNSTYETSV